MEENQQQKDFEREVATDQDEEEREPVTRFVQQPVQLESAMDTESDQDEDLTIEDKFAGEVTPRRAREVLKEVGEEEGGK